MSTPNSVIERLRARIGVAGPPTHSTVEAGHLKRFAEAIGDSNSRWLREAPPTYLVALGPDITALLAGAEEYGKGWLNGGTRFEYLDAVSVGDRLTATTRIIDVYEKTGSTGRLLFIIHETDYMNQGGRTVARLRGTAIRR